MQHESRDRDLTPSAGAAARFPIWQWVYDQSRHFRKVWGLREKKCKKPSNKEAVSRNGNAWAENYYTVNTILFIKSENILSNGFALQSTIHESIYLFETGSHTLALDSWPFCLYLTSAMIIGMCRHAWFVWYWGPNPAPAWQALYQQRYSSSPQ